METKEDIKVANIESELNRLWESQPNTHKMKACLFNLIIYTQEVSRREYFKEIIQRIVEKFPCRVIFIQADFSTTESFLRLHVSTESGADNQTMAFDQITIEAAGSALSQVPFLILPHFIPDLPIYLLWGQDPTTENTILPHLQEYATRLIFDSECTNDLQHFSQTMLVRMNSAKIGMMDLDWARMGGWREVLAQTFDSRERIQQLSSSRLVKIVYNNRPSPVFQHPERQAFYLQGWLAVQLEWEYQSIEKQQDRIVLSYRYKDHLVQVVLQPQLEGQVDSEEILGIEFSDQKNYFISLERKEDLVTVHCSTEYQCELPFKLLLPNIRSGRTFMQEIFYQKISDHYIRLLKLLSRIDWR